MLQFVLTFPNLRSFFIEEYSMCGRQFVTRSSEVEIWREFEDLLLCLETTWTTAIERSFLKLRKESVLGALKAGEKEESIGVKKGTGSLFSPSCQLPCPFILMVFIFISMVLWKWILLVPSWRFIHSYIYSGIIYAFG